MDAYGYCYQNPINLVDPDGQAPTDWIVWTSSTGIQHVTYHPEITSVAQAKTAGYTKVETVFSKANGYTSNTGETFNFRENGKYSVNGGNFKNVADASYTTKGGSIINRALTGPEQVAKVFQGTGDAISSIGIATGQPEIIAVGEIVSNIGLTIEIGCNFAYNGINSETVSEAAGKVAINVGFGILGDTAKNATRTVAGEEFVKTGANIVSESVIEAASMTGNKVTEQIIKQKSEE